MRLSRLIQTFALVTAVLLAVPAFAGDTAEDTTMVDNALLEMKVKMELLNRFGFDAWPIDVEATGGMVSLSGEVEERSVKESAKNVVAALEGVNQVENHLVLKEASDTRETPVGDAVSEGELEMKDAFLEMKVKSSLLAEIGRHGFDVEVEAASGTVSLEGELPNDNHREIALKTAEGTEGVKKVINRLTVAS